MARWTKKLTRREKDILIISARIKQFEQDIERNRKFVGKPNNCGVVVNTPELSARYEQGVRVTIEDERRRMAALESQV